MQMPPLLGQQFIDGRSSRLIFMRTNQPARLIHRQVDLASCSQWAAIHADLVMQWIDFPAQLRDGLAIHLAAAFEDDLFTCSSRGYPGFGQALLETNHGEGKRVG